MPRSPSTHPFVPQGVDIEAKLAALEAEVACLHDSLEAKGVNSRRIKDLRGEVFAVPVDAEHKATQMPILSCAAPHMRAFHASWFGFFSTFFSTFAPAPLAPILKQKNTLALTRPQLQMGNLASVTSNIVCRFLMGLVCDKVGARKGLALVLLFTCPGIIGLAFVQDAAGFIVCRAIIGVGLASFVCCQVWCTQQFSKSIVGVANATAGGWGNLGGGITNLCMPFVFTMFLGMTSNDNEDLAWRLCMIVPLVLHLSGAALALSGRDLPDGNYAELETSGAKQKSDSGIVAKVGLTNINGWILTVTYGFCFGVELTMTNVASQYYYEYFALTPQMSGTIASIFGLVNICARSLGGITSDWSGKKFGMRGRIWALWIFQTLEGILCIIMGSITMGYAAPDFGGAAILGWVDTGSAWVPFNSTLAAINEETITHCSSLQVTIKDAWRPHLDPRISGDAKVVLSEPPAPWGNGDDCVSNSGVLGSVIFVMFLFSVAVQMAEGLTYGIVPSVSRPALGVISGMVGAGGNAGSLITNAAFFLNETARTDQGLMDMGWSIVIVTLLLFAVYFPDMGGMLVGAGGMPCYDPQIIKPPAGYRGADSMDYDNVNAIVEPKKTPSTASATSTTEAQTKQV